VQVDTLDLRPLPGVIYKHFTARDVVCRWDVLDIYHQPTRAELFPALYDIFDAAKEAGAHAAYLSGGGSTVAALATEGEDRIARLMQQAAIARGYSGRTLITEPSEEGIRVLEP
jgi:homoserine kinase